MSVLQAAGALSEGASLVASATAAHEQLQGAMRALLDRVDASTSVMAARLSTLTAQLHHALEAIHATRVAERFHRLHQQQRWRSAVQVSIAFCWERACREHLLEVDVGYE